MPAAEHIAPGEKALESVVQLSKHLIAESTGMDQGNVITIGDGRGVNQEMESARENESEREEETRQPPTRMTR